MRYFVLAIVLFCVEIFFSTDVFSVPKEGSPQFLVDDTKEVHDKVPVIMPWCVIPLDPAYGGQWVVAADLTGDGVPEIISAENFNEGDVHYTSAVAVHKLDGRLLWHWGKPDIGRKTWHHDVACQAHDWDENGQIDVTVCEAGAIVELDGRTGVEKRRIPIEKDATDCIVFCDLAGKGRPTDVLVKNRYNQIWAYDQNGVLLWAVKEPGGYRTAHQPRPIDLDHDGRDEIIAGYALLNCDGTVRWVYDSERIEMDRGHLDCARILEYGNKLKDWRIALTFCGANAIAVADGNGKTIWEVTGYHFESINIGKLTAEQHGMQILVDIDHQPKGQSPIWLFDGAGNKLGELITDYSRHHKLLDWTGDGIAEIVVAHSRALYDAKGICLATLSVPKGVLAAAGNAKRSVLLADMNGNGIQDILLVLPTHVLIYKNKSGKAMAESVALGTGLNVTLY
ncbi:MAG: hypothetical protein KAH38_03145 [Candidatus Hydrogenedentes bacterium]|nr:hypothetical protein [Candidatus Hydrogenedentota bacterium]